MRLALLAASALLLAGCATGADGFPGDYLASAHPTPAGLRLVEEDADSQAWQSMRDAAGMTSNPGKVDLSRWQDRFDGSNATVVEAWAAIYEGQGEDGEGLLVAYAVRFAGDAEGLQWIAQMGCDAFGDEVRIAVEGDKAAVLLAIGDSDDLADGVAALHADIVASTGARDPCADD